VVAVGVVGMVQGTDDELPVVFVQLRKENSDIVHQLKSLCVQYLASYKIPRHFICSIDKLATTTTGKVDKKILRTQLEQLIKDGTFFK